MKITRFSGLAAFAALSLLLVGSSSQAAFVPLPATLDQLLPVTNFTTVGPLTFANFSYTGTGPAAVPATSIGLAAIDGNGLQIAAPFAAGSNSAGDSLIGFTASAAGGISSITLSANPAVSGTGVASITETFYASPTSTVAIGQILVTPGTPGLSQTFFFAQPLTSVYIVKDILYSGGSNGTAQISFVRQTFSVVPEPASVVMMGLGVVGAFGAVRLRRKPVVA